MNKITKAIGKVKKRKLKGGDIFVGGDDHYYIISKDNTQEHWHMTCLNDGEVEWCGGSESEIERYIETNDLELVTGAIKLEII